MKKVTHNVPRKHTATTNTFTADPGIWHMATKHTATTNTFTADPGIWLRHVATQVFLNYSDS
jgi:hypothetical protein